MLELTVHRQNGSLIDHKDPATILYYDEIVEIRCESPRECEMHLYATITGSLQSKNQRHSIAIYDDILPKGKNWTENIHIKHPRSPLQNPHLEVSITARYDSIDENTSEDTNSEASKHILTSFEPLATAKPSFLVPFQAVSSDDSPKQENNSIPIIGYASSFEERRSSVQDLSELVPRSPKSSRSSGGVSNGSASQSSSSNAASSGALLKRRSNKLHNSAEYQGGIEVSRWSIPLKQAIELEMRSMRPALERVRVLAEVNILAVTEGVRVSSCVVSMDDGVAELLGPSELPMVLEEGGIYAQCYNLQLRAAQQSNTVQVPSKELNIAIECELLHSENSETNPRITTTWTPVVDFEGIQGPQPKTPIINFSSQSPHFGNNAANQSSSSVNLAGTNSGLMPPPMPPSVPSSSLYLPGLNGSNRHSSGTALDIISSRKPSPNAKLSLMSGLSIFITGPQFVKVGETFKWKFQAISRSQRERTFAIYFGESNQVAPRTVNHHSHDLLQSYSKYDEDQLRSRMKAYYSTIEANNGIIPLCNGFSVGKLAPQGCFETTIELKALNVGTHTIESSRIRDLATGDTYDVGALLEVIVEPN